MNDAIHLRRASVPWALRVRAEEQAQQPAPVPEPREEPSVAKKKVEYVPEGSDTPRTEAYFIHRFRFGEMLKRTFVVASVDLMRLLDLPEEIELPPMDIEQMKKMRRYKGWSTKRLLMKVEDASLEALRIGFEKFDDARERKRARQVTSAKTPAQARVPLIPVPLLEMDEAAPPKVATLGVNLTSRPHEGEEMLRGRLTSWGPYRGQDGGEGCDPLEQWFVAVETDMGLRHVIGVDLKRAFEASGAVGHDTIRIVKRKREDSPKPIEVIEERHGPDGDESKKWEATRDAVYDIYIEDKPNLIGAEAFRFGGARPSRDNRHDQKGDKRRQKAANREAHEDEKYS